ncbi:CG13306 [Drosophila busckii]|uniref:CG13306 n=1 Tax=Drosophila busckii TaxID=30019 RepID=A0A0M4EJ45_DROBS|nr:CG13306 [Drosophila busckii]
MPMCCSGIMALAISVIGAAGQRKGFIFNGGLIFTLAIPM